LSFDEKTQKYRLFIQQPTSDFYGDDMQYFVFSPTTKISNPNFYQELIQ